MVATYVICEFYLYKKSVVNIVTNNKVRLIVYMAVIYIYRYYPADSDLFTACSNEKQDRRRDGQTDIARSTPLVMLIRMMQPPCQNEYTLCKGIQIECYPVPHHHP